jgi:mRNA-degrading endonuclease RelE of RelBE toxin-antitoxin system
MKFSIIPTDKFKREAKRLIKKFPSLKQELLDLNDILSQNSEVGLPLGNDTYKISIAIKSKGKGKSGGERVITYIVTASKEVYLLTIYDKSEFENVDNKIIKAIIASLF